MNRPTAMLFTVALTTALLIAGCSDCQRGTPGDDPPEAAGTEPEAEEAPEDAEEPAREPDAEDPSEGDAEEAAEPELPEPAKELRAALYGITECGTSARTVRVADEATCLEDFREAKKILQNPPRDIAPEPEDRRELRDALAKVLREALDHEDPTVRLYALMRNQAHFDDSPETLARLEELMESPHDNVAEWAAIARFRRHGGTDERTVGLARNALAEGDKEPVRLAACQYLGGSNFQDERAHFDLLLEYARDEDEAPLIRSCAVTRLGYLGNDHDIPTLEPFLDDRATQYAAIFALQRGLRSAKGWDAYLDWFEANADKDDVVDTSSVTIVLPWKGDLNEGFPEARAARVLYKLANNESLPPRARAFAVEHLATLDATRQLKRLARRYADPETDGDKAVKRALDEAKAE